MHEKLKEYFEKAEEEENKLTAQELISAGLYEKEYSEKNEYSYEYPDSEWDEEHNKQKYFKKVPIQLTDEECEKFKKIYYSSALKPTKPTNPIASALSIIAVLIYIGGFIAGICFANVEVGTYYTHKEFSFAIALIYWAVSLVSGTMFLGFAEIIKLLHDIKNK